MQNNTGSGQPTNPDPYDPSSSLMATPCVNKNLGNNQNPLQVNQNPLVNPTTIWWHQALDLHWCKLQHQMHQIHPFAHPSSPWPLPAISPNFKPTNPVITHVEIVLNESRLYPTAVDEWVTNTLLTSHWAQANLDDKQRQIFYEKYISGLPKGCGYKNIHLKDPWQCNLGCHQHLAHQQESGLQIPSNTIAWHISNLHFWTQWKDKRHPRCEKLYINGCMPCLLRSSNPAPISLYSDNLLWNEDLMGLTETILNSIKDEALKFHVQVPLNGIWGEASCGTINSIFHLGWDCLLWYTNDRWFMLQFGKTWSAQFQQWQYGRACQHLASFSPSCKSAKKSLWMPQLCCLISMAFINISSSQSSPPGSCLQLVDCCFPTWLLLEHFQIDVSTCWIQQIQLPIAPIWYPRSACTLWSTCSMEPCHLFYHIQHPMVQQCWLHYLPRHWLLHVFHSISWWFGRPTNKGQIWEPPNDQPCGTHQSGQSNLMACPQFQRQASSHLCARILHTLLWSMAPVPSELCCLSQVGRSHQRLLQLQPPSYLAPPCLQIQTPCNCWWCVYQPWTSFCTFQAFHHHHRMHLLALPDPAIVPPAGMYTIAQKWKPDDCPKITITGSPPKTKLFPVPPPSLLLPTHHAWVLAWSSTANIIMMTMMMPPAGANVLPRKDLSVLSNGFPAETIGRLLIHIDSSPTLMCWLTLLPYFATFINQL